MIMKLFLDTEFTTLAPGNKLISIALVDENEDFFYAELTDTYTIDDCSDFVKAEVLPYLRGGEYRMSFNECALRLGNWIEAREKECILCMDAPSWDFPFIDSLLRVLWPSNLKPNEFKLVYVSDLDEDSLLLKYGFVKHNALDDAMLMAKADKLKS